MVIHRLENGLPWLPVESLTMLAKQRTLLWQVISRQYWKDCDDEACHLNAQYAKYLNIALESEQPLQVLDIGAGFCGYNILLAKKHAGMKLTVLDASHEDKDFKLGYQARGEQYNDFGMLEIVFEQTNIHQDRYELVDFRTIDVLEWASSRLGQYDVIQSLYSWCFHYPYETYRHAVQKLLKPGGIIVVDCRKIPEQMNLLFEDFDLLSDVTPYGNPSSSRLVLRKKI